MWKIDAFIFIWPWTFCLLKTKKIHFNVGGRLDINLHINQPTNESCRINVWLFWAAYYKSRPRSSCRGGVWIQGAAAAAGHLPGLWNQVCLHRKDQRPSGRGDGHLQRRCEYQKMNHRIETAASTFCPLLELCYSSSQPFFHGPLHLNGFISCSVRLGFLPF